MLVIMYRIEAVAVLVEQMLRTVVPVMHIGFALAFVMHIGLVFLALASAMRIGFALAFVLRKVECHSLLMVCTVMHTDFALASVC